MQEVKLKRIKILLFVISICCGLFHSNSVLAEEISGKGNALDVTFVLDVSGSMKSNDPDGIALDMVKAFIDTVHIQNIRVGFVAYNDMIVSSISPVSVIEPTDREHLKGLIDSTIYSGNTDIGLGLMNAYQSMGKEEQRNRIIVLISDGESDLNGSTTGRTLEQSNQELLKTVELCQEEQIPIYTIAFGNYGGNMDVLNQIAESTAANTYLAESPELLMEVLYDIFNDNLSYKIQRISTGIYALGSQEIRCILDESYLNEIDILMISSQQIGESRIRYAEMEVPLTRTAYYMVGKITSEVIDHMTKELTINTTTVDGQLLDIYLISYRNLEPKLKLDTEILRNQEYSYQVYFQDQDGTVIKDEDFYRNFEWHLEITGEGQFSEIESTYQIEDSILNGRMEFFQSGQYSLTGTLYDHLGTYHFRSDIVVKNTPPTGAMPELAYTNFSKGGVWDLNEYFQDADGDQLSYAIVGEELNLAQIKIVDNYLYISPLKAGTGMINLQISDGEAIVDYAVPLTVNSLWKDYWWVAVFLVLIVIAVLWKILSRNKLKPEMVEQIKSQNQFNGRLDLYFTLLPEQVEEIPPLTFPIYKLTENKIHLGELLEEYQKEIENLELNQVHLVAGEGRKITLYHNSDATVMIRNSIACRKVRYSLTFGDVVYITSKDGTYDLEIHYIAVIQ